MLVATYHHYWLLLSISGSSSYLFTGTHNFFSIRFLYFFILSGRGMVLGWKRCLISSCSLKTCLQQPWLQPFNLSSLSALQSLRAWLSCCGWIPFVACVYVRGMVILLDLYGIKNYDRIAFDYGGKAWWLTWSFTGLFSQIILMLF